MLRILNSRIRVKPHPASVGQGYIGHLSLQSIYHTFSCGLLGLIVPEKCRSKSNQQNGGHLQAFKTYLPNQLPALHLFLLRHNLFFQYNGIEKLSLTQILFPVFIRSFKILPDFMLFFRSSVSIKISI